MPRPDLSRVQGGVIARDERFGYVELVSHAKLDARDFISCHFAGGKVRVTFSVLASFDLQTGPKLEELP